MPHSNLSPVSVVPYGKDYFIDFVRYVTGWNDRNEVANKAQLQYICGYLEVDHINCKTIVVESDYIERHYLEDYAEYYARCFPAHPRKCSRLHFFSDTFTEAEFNKALSGDDETMASRLQESYIGFAVIRPIPHTVFARVCLRPYKALLVQPGCKVLTRKIDVSLFGLPLSVDTVPFIEQDKVVSACATSALWVALGAHSDFSLNRLPSPSSITKSATIGGSESARTFPTVGLSIPQILKGLRHFGLEPSIVWDDLKGSVSELKAQIYSYLHSDTTVILGGAMYKRHNRSVVFLGFHLVCVTGYAVESKLKAPKKGHQKFHSEDIAKLYVHDDRSGPYMRLSMDPQGFRAEDGSKQEGLEMSIQDRNVHLFVPSVAIVGLYHKIRMPYSHVHSACSALYKYLSTTQADVRLAIKRPGNEVKAVDEETYAALEKVIESRWEICLTTSAKVKEEALVTKDFHAFNGLTNKSALLLQNMPKYLWRCRLLDPSSGKRITDLLFDATEVPQGNIFVGHVSFTLEAVISWAYIEHCIRTRAWQRYAIDDSEAKESVGCFLKFFTQDKNHAYLNTIYGPLGLPRRSLKPGETDEEQHITGRGDTHTIRRGDNRTWDFLRPNRKYIWVINEHGDIVIGEDIAGASEFQGHPTLIDGKPGRIAGELNYVKARKAWAVNLKSRAYSGHVEPDQRQMYAKNVVERNLPKLSAFVDEG